jgi:polyferredoxin
MAGKKRKKSRDNASSIKRKKDVALKNFILFVILFILSFLLYSFSSSPLLVNFFGIVSIILGFLAVAFLIVIVVLALAKKGK